MFDHVSKDLIVRQTIFSVIGIVVKHDLTCLIYNNIYYVRVSILPLISNATRICNSDLHVN